MLTGKLQTMSDSVDQVLVAQKEIKEQFTSFKEDILQSTQRDQPSNSSDYILERMLYLLEGISARQSNLEQKIDEDRQRLSKRAKDTDKIDDMNSHLLNVSIQQSRLEHKLDSLLELQVIPRTKIYYSTVNTKSQLKIVIQYLLLVI
jgi:predicted transcriptional regulator